MSDFKNVNLQVARFALKSVKEILEYDIELESDNKDKQKLISKKYKTVSKKMTILIQKNGLIGTLVFVLSKANKEKSHEFILKHIRSWCKEDFKLEFLRDKLKFCDNQSFIESITTISNQEYRLVTKEIMNLFGWIKRFADGMIEGDEQDD
ncbi:type III-B CRISPR module-associated protein Cmr5 [Desnuesiella massiliensis]|uniref:type III-B CRISPR module-associated protein Cmr5 n=1 Tax=Desnuesiella massiliensis TaxID=1650662 RepID=UPI0006E40293|nr:type III-B CRISPR module-associated protein Cmr5 [Desnuesiella massiliensis]